MILITPQRRSENAVSKDLIVYFDVFPAVPLVPSPHSTQFVFISTKMKMEEVPVALHSSPQCTHTLRDKKQRYRIANFKFKYGSGTQPQVSLTTLTFRLQSQFVVFLLITQISL